MTRADGWTAGSSQKRFMLYTGWRPVRWDGTKTAAATAVTCSGVLGDDFTLHGLPRESGITLHVARDGQSWYARRRTVTGWCFAIGAAGPPPDQWEV